MPFNDLREFIEKTGELGECKTVEGADWDLEIGALAEMMVENMKAKHPRKKIGNMS